ncbi:two-component system response regulator ResD [Cytobacillus firmus]|uniref:Two-component system response regulator ResD n=2 Tax=Cytobacillus TaxID=2675230 RepID=A0A366JGT9_CYTFI|nr:MULTISPECIES: response regulator transcription factor [Cytobacillus]RBP86202.1 two-component system response regulator ResD [Cytobacillus firmus]TDX45537.1 two-component system response regulator ResD [Cytobacillus oceanisediminis]
MNKDTVLIVDDEWNMRQLLKIHLSPHFHIKQAGSGKEALSCLEREEVDLIILDIMMPEMNGWEVCEKVRARSEVPILMLTARGDVKDKVQGLSIGADDYLVKPYIPEELVARSKALIRRSLQSSSGNTEEETIEISDLKVNRSERQIFVDDSEVEVTPKEFDLLELLALNPKTIFTRDMLLDQIWGINGIRDIRTIDTHVKNLREKIRKKGLSFNPIRTVWGRGYKFQAPDENE